MKTTPYILMLALLITNCQRKTENNFVGKYKAVYSTRAYSGYNDLKYYDLGLVTLEFFKAQDGRLVGQGSIEVKGKLINGYIIGNQNQDADFDVTNIRLINDTLFFQMENQLLGLAGKKLKGCIVNNTGDIELGLDEHIISAEGVEESPWFISKKNELVYYHELIRDKDLEGRRKKSLADNIKELEARLKDPRLDRRPNWNWEQRAIEKSLNHVKDLLKILH